MVLEEEKQHPTLTPSTKTPIWNIPYNRNPFFTGREDLLHQLHDNLTKNKTAALTQPQAIIGTLANGIEVEKMDRQEGTLLLLRRARVLKSGDDLDHASPADRAAAEAIIQEMDGLPLRFCAFLAPDAIPEKLIVDGASELGPLLQPITEDASLLDEAIATLLRFSLVKRKRDEQSLSVHRLVQTILRTSVDAQTQQQWAERTL